jgi:hypothetical protein
MVFSPEIIWFKKLIYANLQFMFKTPIIKIFCGKIADYVSSEYHNFFFLFPYVRQIFQMSRRIFVEELFEMQLS